jgi:hypothetical protein
LAGAGFLPAGPSGEALRGAAWALRGAGSSGSGSPAADSVAHLGHFTFLPAGSGLAGLRTVPHSGQVSLETAIVVALKVGRGQQPVVRRYGKVSALIVSHPAGFRQTVIDADCPSTRIGSL